MLERSRALAEFVAHMTRLTAAVPSTPSPERLGEYVLVDFVNRRTKRVRSGALVGAVAARERPILARVGPTPVEEGS